MKTRIIATIGNKNNKLHLKKLTKAGADIIRINTKYASEKQLDKIIKNLANTKTRILIDIKNLKLINKLKTKKFDFLAVSFTESAIQIKNIKKHFSKNIKIIAKIETKKGIQKIDEIIKASDGIMVARGDLGKNISFEKVPLIQKLIIKKCGKEKKFDITATEMLLSMLDSKMPSRADVSDIANAVLDGSNAVMLSEETAIGKYPELCIKTMKKVIKETEKYKIKLKK